MPESAHKTSVTAIVQAGDFADTIRDCLNTLTWVDDLFVVDDCSTDGTKEICEREFGARVETHKRENAAAQKNWAIPRARHEWVLVVDADERVSPELRDEVRRIVEADAPYDFYRVRRWNWYFGRIIKHCGWDHDRPVRLFRRDKSRYEDKHVHADVIVEDPSRLGLIEAPLIHYPYQSFDDYLKRLNTYSTWGAKDLRGRGKKATAFRTLGRPAWRFVRQYILQRGFLDGRHGLMLCLWSAVSGYAKYSKLWEMEQEDRSKQRNGSN